MSPEKALEIIKKIHDGHYDDRKHELKILYRNAQSKNFPDIESAAKDRLIQIGDSEFTKRFVAPIREKVESLVTEVAENNNWLYFSDNTVRNGIKHGGELINGQAVAQYYFSYRLKGWKRAISFCATQVDAKSDIFYSVNSPGLTEQVHVSRAEDAIHLFRSELNEWLQ